MPSNIYKLYAFWFFQSLIFAYVIERLFGLERGLNIQEMVYVEIAYACTALIFEVPTGVLADRWGRKRVLVLSAFLTLFEFIFLIFAHNLWGFLASSVAAALAGSLASGASNALFYDSLKAEGQEAQFESVLGRNRFGDYLAGIIGALGGAWVASHYHLTLSYWLSLIGVSVAFCISWTLTEPPHVSEAESEKAGFRSAWQHLRHEPALRFMILYGMFLGTVITYIDEYAQLYLLDLGIGVSWFGVYYVLRLGLDVFVSPWAYRLKGKWSENQIFQSLLVLTLVSCGMVAFTPHYGGLIWLCLCFLAFGLAEPLLDGFLHHRTASYHRATVESMQALLGNMGSLSIGLLFGFVSNQGGIRSGYLFLACVLGGYTLYYGGRQRFYLQNEGSKNTKGGP